MLGEIKAAYARARARGDSDSMWKRMNLPKFRNGHYGTVINLRKKEKEFKAGDWYERVIDVIPKNGQNKLVNLIAELQDNDRRDDKVADKFYWEWWSK